MFGFNNKKLLQFKLTEDELQLKAIGVNFAIFMISDEITEILQREVKELKKLKQEETNQIFFVILYVVLFRAQMFFWDNVIQDKKSARIFEDHLFRAFEKTSGVNPRPYILDLAKYISKGDSLRIRLIQYPGSKICRVLGKKCYFLMMKITTSYASYLEKVFFEFMKKMWELPTETLKDLKEMPDFKFLERKWKLPIEALRDLKEMTD